MRRRAFIAGLGSAAARSVVARGQQNALPVVAYISMRAASRNDALRNFDQLFVQGLSETGFVDQRNVIIDHREAAEVGQIPALGVDLVRNKVAVIVGPTNAIIAAKAVTSTIPMVFIGATEPVAVGLVASLNRPGGNVTGVRLVAGDLPSKQVQVVHEFIPEATKFGLLINPGLPNGEPEAAVASDATRLLRMTPIVERVMTETEFEPAFTHFQQEGANAVLVVSNIFLMSYSDRLAMLAEKRGLPLFGQDRDWAVKGALASYGANIPNVFRQAGMYVGRILKGERPADLPVQQPTQFQLVINLKTAKALGLTVPPTLLARADEVIE